MSSLNNVYKTNRMLYRFQQPRSVKLEPTDILQQPFDDQTYRSSSTMTTSITSGKHFVDPEKSYLNLAIRLEAPEYDVDETGEITYNTSSSTTTAINQTGLNLQELLDLINAQVGNVVQFSYDKDEGKVKHVIQINSTSVVKIAAVVGDTGLYRLLGYYAPGSTIDLGQNIGDTGFGNTPPIVSPLQASFGLGSVQNLFGSIRINHKSGTQIANVQNLDKWVKAKAYLEKDDFWFDTYGFIQGFRNSGADPIWHSATDETRDFKLKLSELHPFFKGTGQLFPPEVIDALRIELDLNNKYRAFASAPGFESYEITSSDIQLALVLVQDEALDIISDEANSKGLEWTYDDVFITTKQVEAIEDNFTVAVDKAVSLAKNVITFPSFTLGNTQSAVDAYDYRPMPSAKWNYRIHNKLYPYQRRITNKFDSYTTAVDMVDWECGNNLTYAEWDDHNAIYVSGLMSDDHIKNAGIFLNANKKVELDFEKANDGNSRLVHTCLEHTKRLSVNTVNAKIDT
jgi:hypothetical protein